MMTGLHSLIYIYAFEGKKKIVSVGSQQGAKFLKLNRSIECCMVRVLLIFHGRVFGRSKVISK